MKFNYCRHSAVIVLAFASLYAPLYAQQPLELPLKNWAAPLYWSPQRGELVERQRPGVSDAAGANPAASAFAVRIQPGGLAPAASIFAGPGPLVFVAVTPCRLVDTRAASAFPAPFGAPSLVASVSRTFPLEGSTLCTIPAGAQAYSLNFGVVPPGPLGFLTVYPTGSPRPNVATLGSSQGFIVSDAAIVPAGTSGSIDVFANNATDLIIDINGVYVSPTDLASNTAIGSLALSAVTTGIQNTAVGDHALQNNTTGGLNTALGNSALQNNTAGSQNTAFGNSTLVANTTGGFNTALGSTTLEVNTTGVQNTATGYGALHSSTGNSNTANGYNALTLLNTGNGNIAIGDSALSNITSGSNNIAIGATTGTTGDTGVIRIGEAGTHTKFFAAGITGVNPGQPSPVPVVVDSNGQLGIAVSSRRFKEDIEDMGDASNGLFQLRPVTFRYKQPYADGSKPLDYGLIAEEVAEVYPDLAVKGADGEIETVQYQKLNTLLLNEVQKQHKRIAEQEEELTALKARLSDLEKVIEKSVAAAAKQ
jgi:hypothetical protein